MNKSDDATYRRMNLRRVEAALPLRVRRRAPLPVVAPLMEAVPPEVIDLTTGPFERDFPELAKRNRRGE